MRSEIARKPAVEVRVKELPVEESSQGYGPLMILVLLSAFLLCYLLL